MRAITGSSFEEDNPKVWKQRAGGVSSAEDGRLIAQAQVLSLPRETSRSKEALCAVQAVGLKIPKA